MGDPQQIWTLHRQRNRVFNGDTGIIEEINDFAETITVNFDEGRMVEYSYKLLDEPNLRML